MASLLDLYSRIESLNSASGLMGWDMQTMMPKEGAGPRAKHMATLAQMRHEILTSDEFGRALEAFSAGAQTAEDQAVVRVLTKELNFASKVPAELVARKSRSGAAAYQAWKVARTENNFPAMVPHYREMFDIAKETGAALGPAAHPYDNLIDLYEEGATFETATKMFGAIAEPIRSLVHEIQESGSKNDDAALYQDWNQPKLRNVAEKIAAHIGFDFARGRLDLAPNAFCSNMGGRFDVRMTTRPSDHIRGVMSSTLHEMGHGLYEQGQRSDWVSHPLGGGISLAVHESQSRKWENIIGRSRGFWRFFFPHLASEFPEVFGGWSDEDFYRAYNRVQPGAIRVGSDELNYNLHILIRFELEVEIVTNALDVADLAEAWNAKTQKYLGFVPETNSLGVLQDVHWSRGSVGYFPTYAMGNLIGAQIWETLEADLGPQEETFARGEFAPTLNWLTEKIYSLGKLYPPSDLVTKVTGRAMEAGPWLRYADRKFREIYSI